MKNWEIWIEGFSITGNSSQASKLGTFKAETFDDAILAFKESKRLRHNQDPLKNKLGNWLIWGCRLYDNEIDARKSFG